ncbi:hypothetical protein PHBOTO_003924 [Pseudozyma hubeiensis]|nr:hypothetical protein PHBOTO_003924 [Pseudozyma hubeiensis]
MESRPAIAFITFGYMDKLAFPTVSREGTVTAIPTRIRIHFATRSSLICKLILSAVVMLHVRYPATLCGALHDGKC